MIISKKPTLIILVLVLLTAAYYLLFVHMSLRNAHVVLGASKTKGFASTFVIAWAKAQKKQLPTFLHDGKNYDSVTGKSK